MSDAAFPGETPDEPQHHVPKHRRDDVEVDSGLDLSEFGENPDTELAG